MKIKVESCWAGGDNFCFRITPPHAPADRFRVYGNDWSRSTAREALDHLVGMGLKRRNVRFVHV